MRHPAVGGVFLSVGAVLLTQPRYFIRLYSTMPDFHYIPIKEGRMTTYVFKVVIEPDDDVWHAYCPALLKQGAATWGATKEEALKHINEVVHMVVAELVEDGEPIPTDVQVSTEPLVSVTI